MLSVCMIVKDEIKFIKDCLEKIAPYVDEIIVVDTGSTDGTLEVLNNFNCKVFHFDWCDDFAKARNYSISKASNDWILILDADEHISKFDKDKIYSYINNFKNRQKVGKIFIKSFIGDKLTDTSNSYVPRLFNKKFFKYTSPIHEAITQTSRFDLLTDDLDIEVIHYGYMSSVSEEKNKDEKYMNLIVNYLKDNYDPYLTKHLAVNLSNMGRYEEAIEVNNTIIDDPEVQKLFFYSDIVQLQLSTLIRLERYDEAFDMQKYYELCSDNDSFLLNMAHVFKIKKHTETALDIYQHLIRKPKLSISRLKPVYALAEIFFEYELYEEALKWYEQIAINDEIKQKINICKEKIAN